METFVQNVFKITIYGLITELKEATKTLLLHQFLRRCLTVYTK